MNNINRVKTDCPHFINVGNICSRVDGMARCDEYSECEFKYIDVLKKEKEQMKEKLEQIKSIVDFNLIFPIYNITKREIGEKIKSIIEGAEDEN